MKLISLLGAAVFLVLLAACAQTPTPAPTAVPPSPTAILPPTVLPTAVPPTTEPTIAATTAAGGEEVTGASLYLLSCSACHGQDHAGQTFDMDGQKISVPALTWSDLSQTYSTDPSRGTVDQQFALAITKGQDESGDDLNAMMPRWTGLSQAQVDSLDQFLQTENATTGTTPTLTGAALDLQGEQLYMTSCASCHGADGAGKTFELDGNTISTPALSWSDLSQTYSDPSRGSVEQQLTLAITKGQDEVGDDLNPMMPRWTFLSQAQVDSLIQFIQSTFK